MAIEFQPIFDAVKPVIATLKPFIPPFVGSVFGYFLEKEESRWKRALAFAVGFSVAVYGSAALAAYFNVKDIEIISGLAFGLGLFGMTLVRAGFEQLPKTLSALSERLIGTIGGSK
jgi:TctA family transporter